MRITVSILAVINLVALIFIYLFNFIFIPSGTGAGFAVMAISLICLLGLGIVNIIACIVLIIKFLKNKVH